MTNCKIRNRVMIILLIFISSCANTHFVKTYESAKGLNFKNTKWLVGYVHGDLDWSEQQYAQQLFYNGLKKFAGDSVFDIDSIFFDYLTPAQFAYTLSEETLQILKKTTDFDYIFCLDTEFITNNIPGSLTPSVEEYTTNQTMLYIVAYDIKNGNKIYLQKIYAKTEMDRDDEKVYFAKSANGLIYTSIKKGVKDIKKYALY